jgi:hypothetical protein
MAPGAGFSGISSRGAGPAAKVLVVIDCSVYDAAGTVLHQGRAGATGAVEAADATPAEITQAVQATALNAFDRYFARDKTVAALNRALEGRG